MSKPYLKCNNPLSVFLKRVQLEGLDLVIYGSGSFFFKERYDDIDLYVSCGRNKQHMDRLYELATSFTRTFGVRIHPFGNPKPKDEDLILVYNRGQILWRR